MSTKSRHIVHIITGLNGGGAEAVLYRLCTNETSHRHTVVSLMDDGKYGHRLREAGVKVYSLHMPQGRVRIGSLVQLWRLLRNHKPDIVQTWMYHADLIGGTLAKLAGVPNILWNIRHGHLDAAISKQSTVRVARACAFLSRFVPAKVVCCAEEAKRVHGELGYKKDKLVVIPNGYDLEHFCQDRDARSRLREEWGVPPETFSIGMVARFDPQKDHENLLTALGLLKRRGYGFRCILVGRGLDEDNRILRGFIDKHDLKENILLLGQRNDIPAVMNALDVHVLSSATEGFPNVVAEAMACGTPCVVTDVGDASLMVGDTGWVVPPRDSKALADAIEEAFLAWKNRESWAERGQAARSRIEENFAIKVMVRNYHRIWASVKPEQPQPVQR